MRMPQARIASEPLRHLVIAIAMAVIFAVSMALAQVLLVSHRQTPAAHVKMQTRHAGDLELIVPTDWTSEELPDPDARTIRSWRFSDGPSGDKRLLINTYEFESPVAPGAALTQMLGAFKKRNAKDAPDDADAEDESFDQSERTAFETPQFVGLRMVEHRMMGSVPVQYGIAVITNDARKYWVIQMISRLRLDFEMRGDDESSALFERICGSTRDRGLLDADDAALRAAGFTDGKRLIRPPGGLHASIRERDRSSGPLCLYPTDGGTHFRELRARVVAAPGAEHEAAGFTPVRIIGDYAQLATGSNAEPTITRETVGGHEAWSVELKAEDPESPAKNLRRFMWYVGFDHGRALLVESLADTAVFGKTADWVARLTEWMDEVFKGEADGSGVPADYSNAFAAALANGEKVARFVRTDIPKLSAPGWEYYLVDTQGHLAGAFVRRTQPAAPGTPGAFRGWSAAIATGKTPTTVFNEWTIRADGSTFTLNTIESGAAIRNGENRSQTIELRGGKLTADRDWDGGSHEPWSASAPSAFIPPMLEMSWPQSWTNAKASGPAIVWIMIKENRPIPVWVEEVTETTTPERETPAPRQTVPPTTAPANTPAKETPQSRRLLLVRPLGALEVHKFVLDAQGKILRATIWEHGGHPDGPVKNLIQSVDRSTLVKRLPGLEPKMRGWEQREPSR